MGSYHIEPVWCSGCAKILAAFENSEGFFFKSRFNAVNQVK
jgi:hypothetical protein